MNRKNDVFGPAGHGRIMLCAWGDMVQLLLGMLPVSGRLLPIAYCLLPGACYRLPVACCRASG